MSKFKFEKLTKLKIKIYYDFCFWIKCMIYKDILLEQHCNYLNDMTETINLT